MGWIRFYFRNYLFTFFSERHTIMVLVLQRVWILAKLAVHWKIYITKIILQRNCLIREIFVL